MALSYKRSFTNPIYLYFKKHICPKCNTILEIVKESKIVNSKSPEAENYDFDNLDTDIKGDVKFVWDIFKCPNCETKITIDDMVQHEWEEKRKIKQNKKATKKLEKQNKSK